MATRDYTLGRGKVLFMPDGETTWKDLGNAPAFTTNFAVETLVHTSSREGLAVEDLEVISKMPVGGSFTLDEPNADVLQMFVMSSGVSDTTQVAAANAAQKDIVLPASKALGRWYELNSAAVGAPTLPSAGTAAAENTGTATLAISGTSAATAAHAVKVMCITSGATGTIAISIDGGDWGTPRAMVGSEYTCVAGDGEAEGVVLTFSDGADLDVGDIFSFNIGFTEDYARIYNIGSTFTLKDVTDTITYVEGAEGVGNYQIDKDAGLVYINIDQASPANPIAAGDTLHVSCSLLDGTKRTNLAATATTIKGYIYFIGNPPQGRRVDIKGFCSITPNGDLSLIGTDWLQCQFNVKYLQETGVTGLFTMEDRGKVG